MRLINFNFNKIAIERLKENISDPKINSKMDILSVESAKSDFLRVKEELIKLSFNYFIKYEPDFVNIQLRGSLILAIEPKLAKEVLKNWKDKQNEKLADFRLSVFNIILKKCTIKALELEEDFGIFPHLPLPSLNKNSLKQEDSKD